MSGRQKSRWLPSASMEPLAAGGGPRPDASAATAAVTSSDVSTYAQLRASVHALIDDYDEVAAIFASSAGGSTG
jgi:hypothetical protein